MWQLVRTRRIGFALAGALALATVVGPWTPVTAAPSPAATACSQAALQAALTSATPDTSLTIAFAPGCVIKLTSALKIRAGVSITMNGNGLIIDGQHGPELVSMDIIDIYDTQASPSRLTLNQVTLENGATGIYDTGAHATVTLQGSAIKDIGDPANVYTQVFGIFANIVTLSNSVITDVSNSDNGNAASVATGILAYSAATLINSAISGIHTSGGYTESVGIFTDATSSSVTLTNSTIDDLSSAGQFDEFVSGIDAATATVTMTNSILTGVSGTEYDGNGYAGKVTGVDGSAVRLTNSIVSDVSSVSNTSGGLGFGVTGEVTITNSTISNVSSTGQAMHTVGVAAYSAATVTNSTISDISSNGSDSRTFGIETLIQPVRGLGTVRATSSTISDIRGTGDHHSGASIDTTTLELTASIVSGGEPNCEVQHLTDGGYNQSASPDGTDNSCDFAASATSQNVTTSQLNLQPLADNGGPLVGAPGHQQVLQTQAPGSGSTAIDQIPVNGQQQCLNAQGQVITDPAAGQPITTDERGVQRPQGPKCDVGAYEAIASPTITLLPGSTTVPQGDAVLIRIAVLSPSGENISSRTLPVTATALDGPSGQVLPVHHTFHFGHIHGVPGYKLVINSRKLTPGRWILHVQVGGATPTMATVGFTVVP